MLSVSIMRIQDKNLWGVIRGGQHTNRFLGSNINGSWEWIRGILVYFLEQGISSMVIGRRFRYGLTPSTGNLLLKES